MSTWGKKEKKREKKKSAALAKFFRLFHSSLKIKDFFFSIEADLMLLAACDVDGVFHPHSLV